MLLFKVTCLVAIIISCEPNKSSAAGPVWYPFRGLSYSVQHEQMVNFTEAIARCNASQATLALVPDNATMKFIKDLVAIKVKSWIGLTANGTDFTWLDGTPLLDSQRYFTINGTARLQAGEQRCVLVSRKMLKSATFCSFERGYICQKSSPELFSGSQMSYLGGVPMGGKHELTIAYPVCQNPLPNNIMVTPVLPRGNPFTHNVTLEEPWGFTVVFKRTLAIRSDIGMVKIDYMLFFPTPTTTPATTTTTRATTTRATTTIPTTTRATTTRATTTIPTTTRATTTRATTTIPTTTIPTTTIPTTRIPTTTIPTTTIPTTTIPTTTIPTTTIPTTTISTTTIPTTTISTATIPTSSTALSTSISTTVKTAKTTQADAIPADTATSTSPYPTSFTQIAKCNATTIVVDGSSLTFAQTEVGLTVMSAEMCGNVRPIASVDCIQDLQAPSQGYFGAPFSIPCNTTVAGATAAATSPNATTAQVSRSVASIKLLTNKTTISNNLAHSATNALFKISTSGPQNLNVSINTMYDAMLTTEQIIQATPTSANPNSMAVKRQTGVLRQSLQNFADRVTVPVNATSAVISTSLSTIQVNKTTRPPQTSFAPVSYAPPSAAGSSGHVSATVPGSILDQASIATGNPSTVRVAFIVQHNSKLYPSTEHPTVVISVSIKGYTPITLKTPIRLTFTTVNKTQGDVPFTNGTLKSVVTRTQCSVYEPQTASWIPNGCRLVTGTSPPQCSCHTLSSFSMIVSSKVLPSAFAMGIASYVGIALSVLGLILTIIIYLTVQNLRVRQPTHFLVNICFNLLAADLVFVLGVDRSGSHALCYMVTALLQYFLLVTWFWMSANAYNMYSALTKVAHIAGSSTTLPTVACYLIPLAIVAINCGATIPTDEKNYHHGDIFFEPTYHHRSMCWLRSDSLYYGFLLPVGILALLNFACFVVVICKLTCLSNKVQSTAHARSRKDDFVIAVAVLIMMGLTWIFGFLMLLSEDVVYLSIMAWLFTVFNSLQGFLIFILNCLRQEKIRKMWLHPCWAGITCKARKSGDARSDFLMMSNTHKTS